MSSKNEVFLEPVERSSQDGTGRVPNIKNLYNNHQLDVVLKLSAVNAYDGARRILDAQGDPVPGSDVGVLLEEAMSPKRVLTGLNQFVDALVRARVEPSVILNDNIRLALARKSRGGSIRSDIPRSTEKQKSNRRAETCGNKTPLETARPKPVVRLKRLNLDDYRDLLLPKRKGTIQPA